MNMQTQNVSDALALQPNAIMIVVFDDQKQNTDTSNTTN